MKVIADYTLRESFRSNITKTYGSIVRDSGAALEARVDAVGDDEVTTIWYRPGPSDPWTLRVDGDLFEVDGRTHISIAGALVDSFRKRKPVTL